MMTAVARVTLMGLAGLASICAAACADHASGRPIPGGGAGGEWGFSTGAAGTAAGTGDASISGSAGAGGRGGVGVDGSDASAGVTGTGGADAGAAGTTGGGGTGAAGSFSAPPGSPVALHGVLQAKGAHVVDASGSPAQLKGMSFYWSQDTTETGYYNADVISWLAQDWHVSIVRAAIAVTGNDDGDYLSNPAGQLALLDKVVKAAVANGIYVLVDWHDHHASAHLTAAKQFFSTVSEKYAGLPNVIYEIWNEPRGNEGLTWTGDLKTYADTISGVIRQHDSKNLMVAGTPFWDQQPDAVIGHEVNDPNVAYTLHFYAGYQPHFFEGTLGDAAKKAVAGGVPLFVTEWGTVDPTNQTVLNETESRAWMTWLDANHISSCNWSISDKSEGSAALRPGTSQKGHWGAGDLTASGTLVRKILLGN